ncbi:hemicentin-1 [Patella vulgata]|uniref:hemicentin-1 n=1 Tax=Patella vulgata TaxID=6465 RepID=UPI0024A9F4D5|nr:hemicentin-1 [Patella vulgata]
MTRINKTKMKEDRILWIFYLLALCMGQVCGQTAVKSRISTSATLRFNVSRIPSNDLMNLNHPTGNVVFLILSSGGKLTSSQPRESVYMNRTRNAIFQSQIFSFILDNIVKQDGGLYTCQYGICEQKLIVLDRPSKPNIIAITPFIAFEESEFNCSATSTTLPKDHGLTMKYVWEKNNQILPETGHLFILPIDKSNQGDIIRCKAYEEYDLQSEISDGININVKFSPEKINIKPEGVSAPVNENVSVSCTSDCKPECKYEWKKQDGDVISTGNILNMVNIERTNDGTYTCTASNDYGTSSENFILNVLYGPVIESASIAAASIAFGSIRNVTAPEKSHVNISLKLDSNPKPDVTWKNNGQPINKNNIKMLWEGPIIVIAAGSKKYLFTSTLRIIDINCNDMGMYSGRVSNNYGSKTVQDFYLTVLCSPQIDEESYFKDEFAPNVGDSVDIILRVVAYPEPVIKTIYHNGISLPSTAFDIQTNNDNTRPYITVFKLTKTNISISDLGYYNVEFNNDNTAGSVNITFHFKERGPPTAPKSLRATDVTAETLTLHWTSAFDGGVKQIFKVGYKNLYGNWTFYNQTYSDPGEGLTVSAEVKGLRELTVYSFRVVSKNVYGQSDFTEAINVTTEKLNSSVVNAGMSSDTAMYIGIGVCAAVLLLIIIVVIIVCIRKNRKTKTFKKKDRFFKRLRERWPMIAGDHNDNITCNNDLTPKENHIYEDIQPTSSRISPSRPSVPPPKPERTFEEEVELRNQKDPIWKPAERKLPKVNENTEHLHNARKSLKPVANKVVLS